MKDDNFKAIFKKSGNSMIFLSNKNQSKRSNRYIMNNKVSTETRKKNKEKVSIKVVGKDFHFIIKSINKSLEEQDYYAKTHNLDSDDDLLENQGIGSIK